MTTKTRTLEEELALMTETQPMEVVPRAIEAPFSQWTHYNPILVETLAAHGDVPEQEVVDHLRSLFDEAGNQPTVYPLDRAQWVLSQYLEQFVAVG